MNYRNFLFLLSIIFVFTVKGFGQSNGSVIIDISKLKEDSLKYYSIAVLNKSDSTLCFLYSFFFSLKTAEPQRLAFNSKSSTTEYYSLIHSIEDNLIDPSIGVYKGECILPYQAKIFTISVPINQLKKELSINYFYKEDYCHSAFMKEIKKRGWYRQYRTTNETKNLN